MFSKDKAEIWVLKCALFWLLHLVSAFHFSLITACLHSGFYQFEDMTVFQLGITEVLLPLCIHCLIPFLLLRSLSKQTLSRKRLLSLGFFGTSLTVYSFFDFFKTPSVAWRGSALCVSLSSFSFAYSLFFLTVFLFYLILFKRKNGIVPVCAAFFLLLFERPVSFGFHAHSFFIFIENLHMFQSVSPILFLWATCFITSLAR